MEYRHTQVGGVVIVTVMIVIILILFPAWLSGTLQFVQGAVAGVLGAALALFCSLTVEVRDLTLVCSFGPGLIKKRILLSDVEEVHIVRNPWYVGWGIRRIPGQYWLWNVSGFQAVELVCKDGTRFRIGTDEPESLLLAIQANRAAGTRPGA